MSTGFYQPPVGYTVADLLEVVQMGPQIGATLSKVDFEVVDWDGRSYRVGSILWDTSTKRFRVTVDGPIATPDVQPSANPPVGR